MNNMDKKSDDGGCQGAYWWATLVVAVLAVPSFGVIVSLLSHTKGIFQILIFMLACWFCTYLGMRLMHNPKMNEKIGHHKNP